MRKLLPILIISFLIGCSSFPEAELEPSPSYEVFVERTMENWLVVRADNFHYQVLETDLDWRKSEDLEDLVSWFANVLGAFDGKDWWNINIPISDIKTSSFYSDFPSDNVLLNLLIQGIEKHLEEQGYEIGAD